MEKILKFPDGFYWGSATSSYQTEGGNLNNWTVWEKNNAEKLAKKAETYWANWQREKFPEMLQKENYIAGMACDSWSRFEEDFDILFKLNQNAYRFSLEWSRIEPEKGKFNYEAILHYRKMLKALRRRNIEPFVTIWHWGNPLWAGNHADSDFVENFKKYVEFVSCELGDLIKFWIVINEATVITRNGYLQGVWPPGKKNLFLFIKGLNSLIACHNASYDIIKKINPNSEVGSTSMLNYFEPSRKNSFLDKNYCKILRYWHNEKFIKETFKKSDFIGVNYYFHNRLKFPKVNVNENKEVTDLGWEIYPQGLYEVLKDVKKYNLPVYIMENGLADSNDTKREKFIKEHLSCAHKAMEEGVDLRGYFYWSLLDNFEWDKGFWPQFGLAKIDRKTLERKIRNSARVYGEICKSNKLEYK